MKYNILLLIANHTNSKLKYNVNLNNLYQLYDFVKEIVIIDSEEEKFSLFLKNDLRNLEKIKKYFLIKNDKYYDFGKWIYGLNNFDISIYDYILFVNDSIIITENINKYFNYIEKNIDDNINLFAYNDSTQISYHYQSYLFLIKKNAIDNFKKFFDSKKELIHDFDSIIENIELNMTKFEKNHSVFIKIGNEYNQSKNLYWHNENLYKYLMENNIFALIKVKKILEYYENFKITIYSKKIEDFDYKFYREQYDFYDMNDDELLNHFINDGQFEGRKFKNNFYSFLPEYYKKKINTTNLLHFTEIPDDFDLYYYRKNNSDLENYTLIELLIHYINHGCYESRNYSKSNINNNIKINNFYQKIYNKFEKKKIELPNNFNLYSTLLISKNLNNCYYYNLLYLYNKNNDINFTKEDLKEKLKSFNLQNYKKINKLEFNDKNNILDHYFKNNFSRNYNIPSDFDHNQYKKFYKDLKRLNNDELEDHYLKFGFYEKRIYKLPDDFDCNLYKEIYDDLKNFENEKLKTHYMNFGFFEKRIYKLPDDFDHKQYKKNYTDIQNLDNNELENHYLKIGLKEKRIYKLPEDFDYDIYRKIYNDLSDFNEEELKKHYMSVGILEKRIYKIPDDFDYNEYKKLNTDLSHLSKIELINHYLNYGLKEGRFYKLKDKLLNDKLNTDLLNLENNDTKKDKIPVKIINLEDNDIKKDKIPVKIINLEDNDIKKEKTKKIINNNYLEKNEKLEENDTKKDEIPVKIINLENNDIKKENNIENFDSNTYKKIYKDLKNLNNDELKNHFLNYGLKEGRIYKLPDDFDHETYKSINYDLSNLSKKQLEDHYLFHGINEKRIYKLPEDFDYKIYRSNYKDLSEFTEQQLKYHYLHHGRYEKRFYK